VCIHNISILLDSMCGVCILIVMIKCDMCHEKIPLKRKTIKAFNKLVDMGAIVLCDNCEDKYES